MANTTLNTRLKLKYDSYTNWESINPVLLSGEVAVVVVPAAAGAVAQEPAILLKVGDGTTDFKTLPWISGLAADVYSWAKAATKPEYQASEIKGLESFIAGEIQDTDTQYTVTKVNDYQYKLMSKAKGDASFSTEVATIDIPNDTTAIQANANAIDALELLVGSTSVANQIAAAITGLDLANTYDAKGAAAQALTDAKTYTDGKDTAMDTRVKELEAKFTDGEGSVADQIANAVAVEASARETAVAGVQAEVDALEQLHATDKSNLETAIAEAKKAGDDAQAHSEGVATNLATEVSAREALAGRVSAIEADYLVEADKTELQGNINTVSSTLAAVKEDVDTFFANADMTESAKDTLKELQEYIASDTTGAAAMAESIQQNKTAIESNDADILALQNALDDAGGIKARLTSVETVASQNTADIATKASQTDLTTLTGRVDSAELNIANLSSTVDTKAAQSDLTALTTKVTTAEGKITTLEEKMDTAQADIETLKTDIAKKANDADLAAIAKSGDAKDLTQTAGDYIIFNCGTAVDFATE